MDNISLRMKAAGINEFGLIGLSSFGCRSANSAKNLGKGDGAESG